jgi:hypothetical protein
MVIRLGTSQRIFPPVQLGHEGNERVSDSFVQPGTAGVEPSVKWWGAAGTNGDSAIALRQLAEGQSIRTVAAGIGLTPKTVWLVSGTIDKRV